MYDNIKSLAHALASAPEDPAINLLIGIEYEKIGQTATAISHYLRCAEYGYFTHQDLVYSALLRMGICFDGQSQRDWSVSNSYLQALEYLPERPEAYLFLARYYEKINTWQESYTMSSIGLRQSKNNHSPLQYVPEYPGPYALEFQKAVSGWWVGRVDESREIFFNLLETPGVQPQYLAAVTNNLRATKMKMDKIGIVLPVRDGGTGRAKRLKTLLPSWEKYTEGLSNIHVLVDEDDLDNFSYLSEYSKIKVHVVETGLTLMQKINVVGLDLAAIYKYIAFIGDDIVFKTKWESKFIEYLSSVPAGLVYANIPGEEDKTWATHPCITSNMIEAVGFYGCPAVHHNYFDNFWTEVCSDIGNIKKLEDVIMDHNSTKLPPDDIFYKVIRLQQEDKPRYEEYKKNQFAEDLNKIKAVIGV